MKGLIKGIVSGQTVKVKTLRSSGFTLLAIFGSNGLRLVSNLILTRLLFPEAFGIMALVQVFIAALGMFSDTGIRTAIIRHDRGDDPVFLNTAWTIQIIRGILLWVATCAVAYPAAAMYDAPILAQLLPVAGLTAFMHGFMPTKVIQANRHLMLGRITIIDLSAQFIGLLSMTILAILLESVWALVLGGLVGTFAGLVFNYLFVPGNNNRLQWDKDSVSDMFRFGKFIFLSTAATLVMQQGDKAIMGGFVSLAELGVYNIAYMLASFPLLLCFALNAKVIQPLYRIKPLEESAANRANVFKARRLVIGTGVLFSALLAHFGIPLVNLMYDDRFALAGPIVMLTCFALVPRISFMGYNGVLLAKADSKSFFFLNLMTGSLQLIFMIVGVIWFGVFGVIMAMALASLCVHPVRVHWIRPLRGWDPISDIIFLGGGLLLTGFACWREWDQIALLLT